MDGVRHTHAQRAAMNGWTFFSWIFQQVIPPVISSVQAIISALSAYCAPVLLAAIGAYLAGRLIMLAYAPTQEPIGVFMKTLTKCAMTYGERLGLRGLLSIATFRHIHSRALAWNWL
jgi:hypothetical protein